MPDTELIKEKITDVEREMKRTGLWRERMPYWVGHFPETAVTNETDFCDWLQFIYLPNLLKQTTGYQSIYEGHYVAPQAIKFFKEDVQRGKLLQLLVELDSLS